MLGIPIYERCIQVPVSAPVAAFKRPAVGGARNRRPDSLEESPNGGPFETNPMISDARFDRVQSGAIAWKSC